jgi:hypothetical protein
VSVGIEHLIRPDGNIILADGRRAMCWRLRVMAARRRVPKPSVYRFYSHHAWHYCAPKAHFDPCNINYDDYIEVTWS